MALPMLFCNIEIKIYVPDGFGGELKYTYLFLFIEIFNFILFYYGF